MNLIECCTSPEMISNAKQKEREMPSNLRNSIRKGKGTLAGLIGEEIVIAVLKGTSKNTFNYDLVVDGLKYEVKTKVCSSKPLDYYECAVSEFNPDQQCDAYVFVRLLKDYSKGWVCGKLSRDDFFKKAKIYDKDDHDPSNGWTCSAGCYQVQIKDLDPFEV